MPMDQCTLSPLRHPWRPQTVNIVRLDKHQYQNTSGQHFLASTPLGLFASLGQLLPHHLARNNTPLLCRTRLLFLLSRGCIFNHSNQAPLCNHSCISLLLRRLSPKPPLHKLFLVPVCSHLSENSQTCSIFRTSVFPLLATSLS